MVLVWNLLLDRDGTLESARYHAQSAFEKDLVYRRWAAGHGGVYVPISENTPPNPYLTNVEERDITTPSGRRLTLINPAYMTRQVHELEAKQYGLRGHITSLNPINPKNAADPWEAEALRAFEKGEAEAIKETEIEGESYMRLMRPMITEESCLKCHADQGYKVGDIRGGISVTVPMAPLLQILRDHSMTLILGQSMIWILGLGGIGLGVRSIKRWMHKQNIVETVLRDSEELHRITLGSISDAVFITTDAGVFTYICPNVDVIFGYSYQEAEKLGNIKELLGAKLFEHDELEATKEIKNIERDILDKAGKKHTLLVNVKRVSIQRGTILYTCRDITERKRVERALQESEIKYRTLFEAESDTIFLVDEETLEIIDANPTAVRMYGYTREEFKKLKAPILSAETSATERVIKDRKETTVPLRYHRKKDGMVFPVEISASRCEIHGKHINVSTIRDITERRKAEEALRENMEELKHAKEAADAANRAKSAFLANMSHELRTPLNSIIGFSQILEMDTETFSDQQLEYLDYIISSGNHLLEMVNDILDLSKIEADKIEIETKPFRLNTMLERIPSMVRSLVHKKKINIELNIAPDLGVIEADEVRLKQVIYNLLSNAIKFTDFGRKIGIEASRRDDWIVIEVWDEGVGITEEDLDKIFDPFHQVGRTDLDKPEGTGLGLPISKRLVELQEGTLTVYSELGQGSRFTIRLHGSLATGDREVKQGERGRAKTERHVQGGKILLVEDNELNIKFITTVLDRAGYRVHSEKLAEDGVNAALKEQHDLILMDIQLPDMSGIEAMKRIRDKLGEKIPIVACTAYAMKGEEEKLLGEGFDGYISKPVHIRKMLQKIETLLKG